jgi:hypothetical protein
LAKHGAGVTPAAAARLPLDPASGRHTRGKSERKPFSVLEKHLTLALHDSLDRQ